MKSRLLCHINDIPEGKARGFDIETDTEKKRIFVVRKNDRFYAYLNKCPHTGVNLDWMPDRLFDHTGEFLQCSTHGALFRIEDGFCIAGPCAKQSLIPINITQNQDKLEITNT